MRRTVLEERVEQELPWVAHQLGFLTSPDQKLRPIDWKPPPVEQSAYQNKFLELEEEMDSFIQFLLLWKEFKQGGEEKPFFHSLTQQQQENINRELADEVTVNSPYYVMDPRLQNLLQQEAFLPDTKTFQFPHYICSQLDHLANLEDQVMHSLFFRKFPFTSFPTFSHVRCPRPAP